MNPALPAVLLSLFCMGCSPTGPSAAAGSEPAQAPMSKPAAVQDVTATATLAPPPSTEAADSSSRQPRTTAK